MAGGKAQTRRGQAAEQDVRPDAGRDPVAGEVGAAVADVDASGTRTAGGDSITPGTVQTDETVRRSDDAAIADVRSGVIADNQPVWDADKGELVTPPRG